MDSAEIVQVLQPIFRDILDLPALHLTAESSGANVEGWDSLAQINLVVAIEKRFKVKFALSELLELKNVGEMAALIDRKTRR